MSNALQLSDLTKVNVALNLKFDSLDAILILTTGGIGYLARAAYNHYDTKQQRFIELQQKNLSTLMDEAQARGASAIYVRVHPGVSVFEPSGGSIEVLNRVPNHVDYKITFGSS